MCSPALCLALPWLHQGFLLSAMALDGPAAVYRPLQHGAARSAQTCGSLVAVAWPAGSSSLPSRRPTPSPCPSAALRHRALLLRHLLAAAPGLWRRWGHEAEAAGFAVSGVPCWPPRPRLRPTPPHRGHGAGGLLHGSCHLPPRSSLLRGRWPRPAAPSSRPRRARSPMA